MQSQRPAASAATAVRLGVLPSGAADLLDYLAPPSSDLTPAALQPCRVTLAAFEAELVLAIAPPAGSSRQPYRLPIEKAWHAPLLKAFAPRLGRDGALLVRPCRLLLEWSTTGLVLELLPEADTWVPLPLPPGVTPAWLGIPLVPVAAAAAIIAAMPILPALAADYVVKPGDTLYAISGRVMGGSGHWSRLYAANRDKVKHPRLLMPGTRLRIPTAHKPAAMRSGTVVVRSGDTLYGLARRHLGNGERWSELWQQVKGRVASPERLPVGLVLHLPGAKPPPTSTVRTVVPKATATPRPSPFDVPAPSATPFEVPAPDATPFDVPAPSATPSPIVMPEPVASAPPEVPEPVAAPTDVSDGSLVELPAAEPTALPLPDAPVSDGSAAPNALAPGSSAANAIGMPQPEGSGTMAADEAVERPFASHLALSYRPRNHTEALSTQSLAGQATVFTSFGAEGSWRAHDHLELAASYLYNHYPVDRGTFGRGDRHEQHSRLMGYYVWPAQPNLELAIGLGGLISDFGQAAMPVTGRTADYYDRSYQRLLADVEAKVGYRPLPALPLTLTAGVSALPIGAPAFGAPGLPDRFWGLGWHAGARYTVGGWAVETGYRGQRVFADGYQQTSDLLHGTVGYYFK